MLSFLGSISLYSQQKYYTKSGYVSFDSRIDSFVPVKAANNLVSAVFDTNNGDIAALAFIKAIEKNKKTYVYPWQMSLLSKIINLLPQFSIDSFVYRSKDKITKYDKN